MSDFVSSGWSIYIAIATAVGLAACLALLIIAARRRVMAGEVVYDHPCQWGSKRTGPDLHRVGGKYSDEWHRLHMNNPRDLVPESNMPAYPWLEHAAVEPASVPPRLKAMQRLGVPYSDAEIAASAGAVTGRTEMDALVAYLQSLGTHVK